MLSKEQFEVLSRSLGHKACPQCETPASFDVSPASENKAICELKDEGLLGGDGIVTDKGLAALEPYRVRGAIILAAGAGTRIAPFSFERPKALLSLHGEILIERMIRQLKAVGIEDITVVVGCMRERLFYLEDSFGVRIVTNRDYATRNSYASFLVARDYAAGAYLCSCDQYFDQNPFEQFVYGTTCTAICVSGRTEERILEIDRSGYVTASRIGGEDALCMLGPTYLDADGAIALTELAENAYGDPSMVDVFWEKLMMDNLSRFHVRVKVMPAGSIHEFDSFSDLVAFDQDFLENVDSRILDNICGLFGCGRSEVSGIEPVKAGLTNLSFLFTLRGSTYVYRHPGSGSELFVNREAEELALRAAKRLRLDNTYIYEDPKSGWKVSRFVEGCTPFNYDDDEQVKRALGLVRRLHQSGETSPWSFDPYENAQGLIDFLSKSGYRMPADFAEISGNNDTLAAYLRKEPTPPVLCHNDFYGPNILVHTDGTMDLIDWEFAAMGDYGYDIGNFVSQGSGYSVERSIEILDYYFGRQATAAETRHCIACVALIGFYWYVWAMVKEVQGSPVGDWLDIWYRAAKTYGKYAIRLYEDTAAFSSSPLSLQEFALLAAKADSGEATQDELFALEPYRVKRAVLLASGLGSRLRPVTINTPKPLVRVNGRRIVATILDALRGVGIDDVIIVRGYLADEFDALLREYPGLRFVDNPLYGTTNNISSALAAASSYPRCFENAYVFEADLFIKNASLVSRYQYGSNYLGVPVESTEDWCFDVEGDRITGLHKGGGGGVCHMFGVSYWTAEDGARLAGDLRAAFSDEGNRQRFWDDVPCVLMRENYDVRLRTCSFDDVVEVDSFAELCELDATYRA